MNVPDTAVMSQVFTTLVVSVPSKPQRLIDKRIELRHRQVDTYQPLILLPT